MGFEGLHLDDYMDDARDRVVVEVKDQFVGISLFFAVLIVTDVTVLLFVRWGCYSLQGNPECRGRNFIASCFAFSF